MGFPEDRPRRLRRTAALRGLVRETRLSPAQLIFPLFVREGSDVAEPIGSLPGQFRYSVDRLPAVAREVQARGLGGVLLFGLPDPAEKDARGSQAWHREGIVQRALQTLKEAHPQLLVATDVCLCEYTDHGHCGILEGGEVHNDATLELLAETALSHARAGADIVAPSDMMDGRVAAIRNSLEQEGFSQTVIMSYSAKYASAFYGPFREAAASAPAFGDRSGYQMDPANAREALREMELDLEEGADILMVKPALPYLDVLRQARAQFAVPLAAYQVSGEYAMLKAAGQAGWLDERRAALETLTAIARAGADIIMTYYALELAEVLG